MRSVRVRAPAKINWTLEVLGKRPDGYHEIRSVMQTIDICDTVMLEPADELLLRVHGDRSLRQRPPERNLAFLAAQELRRQTGVTAGARIVLGKEIPLAAGLGGGSSDAAAVLRGLRALWELDCSDEQLASIAAELGSDVSFFVFGGAAIASGRGGRIERLPEVPSRSLAIAWPKRPSWSDKTARSPSKREQE